MLPNLNEEDSIILENNNCIGYTITIDNKLLENVRQVITDGCYVFGLQLQSFRSMKLHNIDFNDFDKLKYLIERFPMFCFYKLRGNLCGTTKRLAWIGNTEQDNKTKQWIKELEQEICSMSKLNGCVILSAGAYRYGKPNGIESSIKSLERISVNKNETIVIENGLPFYDSIVCSLQELKEYQDLCFNNNLNFVRIALNIVHFFVSGLYDFRIEMEIDRFFNEIDNLQILPCVILLADSAVDFMQHQVQIVNIGEGCIWNKNNLKLFLNKCLERGLYVLTPTYNDMTICKHIINKF